MFMRVHQRVTFIFRRKGESFESVHIHNSDTDAWIILSESFQIRKQYTMECNFAGCGLCSQVCPSSAIGEVESNE